MTYEEMVEAIGPGFHPDNYGADYVTLPPGITPSTVNHLVNQAWADWHAGRNPHDPYERALKVL